MIKGAELLAKIAELGDVSRADVARACGYASTKKDGSERILFAAFYEAIIDAKGVTLAPPSSKVSSQKRGKPLAFNVKVSKTGVIPITAGYSALIDVADGDRVDIEHVDGALILRKAVDEVIVTPVEEPVTVTYDDEPAPAAVDPDPALAPF